MAGEMALLGDRIIEQAAHLDAAMQRLLADIRAFDASGAWAREGMQSCAHWLSWRVGWSLAMARDRVRVARGLGEFPTTEACLASGELSYSQVRAVLRVATPQNENMLLEVARLTTAEQLETVSRKYASVQEHDKASSPLDDRDRRHVRRRAMPDGMIKIEATLHPEEAEMVWAMLDHAAKQLSRAPAADPVTAVTEPVTNETQTGNPVTAVTDPAVTAVAERDAASGASVATSDPVTAVTEPVMNEAERGNPVTAVTEPAATVVAEHDAASGASAVTNDPVTAVTEPVMNEAQRGNAVTAVTRPVFNRADGLMMITQAYLRGERMNRAPVDITVTIPMSALSKDAQSDDVGCVGEAAVDGEAVRRMSCDAGVVEVTEDEHGVPVSVGRKRRTISGSIKRALLKRDTACTFPGCTNHVFLEGHHIRHWADGGETSLANLVILCSHHHRFVHEYGYTIELADDGRPQFRDLDGRLVVAVPERARPAGLGWESIEAANANADLKIDANGMPCWDGTPISYGRLVGHLAFTDRRRA